MWIERMGVKEVPHLLEGVFCGEILDLLRSSPGLSLAGRGEAESGGGVCGPGGGVEGCRGGVWQAGKPGGV